MTLLGNAQPLLGFSPGANASGLSTQVYGEQLPAIAGQSSSNNIVFDSFYCYELTRLAAAAGRMQQLGPQAPMIHSLVDPTTPVLGLMLVLEDLIAATITAQACETVFGYHEHITLGVVNTLVGVGFRAGADHIWHAFVNDCPTGVAPVTVRRDTATAILSTSFHHLKITIDGRDKTIRWYIDNVLVDSWTPPAALDQMSPTPGPKVMWSMTCPLNGAGKLRIHAGGIPQMWAMVKVELTPVPIFSNRGPVVDLPTTFDASLSTASLGSIFTWSWGDGTPDTVGTDQIVTHTYANEGYYDVTLTISDSTQSASTTHTVLAGNSVSTISCRELLSAARARDYRFMNAAMPDGALMLFLNTKQRTLLLQLAPSIEQIVGEILQVASLVGGVLTASDAVNPGFPLPVDYVKLIDVKATHVNGRALSIDIIPENEAISLSAPTRVPTAYISANRIVPVRLGVGPSYNDSWSQVAAVSISYVGMKTVQLLDDFISLPGVLHEALIAGLVVVLSRGVPGLTKPERDEYVAESVAADKQTAINAVDMLGDVTERKVNYSR